MAHVAPVAHTPAPPPRPEPAPAPSPKPSPASSVPKVEHKVDVKA
jgi:hypothetical protein